MVKKSISFILLLLSFATPGVCAESDLIHINITPSENCQFGKPIQVEIRVPDAVSNPDTMDISIVKKSFFIDSIEQMQGDGSPMGRRMRLQLYPRYQGRVTFPELQIEGFHSRPLVLDILAPREDDTNRLIITRLELSNTQAWVNQPLKAEFSVESESTVSRLEVGSTAEDGLDSIPLSLTKEIIEQDGRKIARSRVAWIARPKAAGDFDFGLPEVRYIRNGVATHRFFPALAGVHVRTLPEYIPSTMPMDLEQVRVVIPKKLFFISRELTFLNVEFAYALTSDANYFGILRQIRSSPSLSFYAPREVTSIPGWNMGKPTLLNFEIPFTPKSIGRIALPDLRVQYFDTHTGKIIVKSVSMGSIFVLQAWMLYSMLLVLILVLTFILVRLYGRAMVLLRRMSQYGKALALLRGANSAKELKAGLVLVSCAENWPANLTLMEWYGHWAANYPRGCNMSVAIGLLQENLYGRGVAPVQDIRGDLLKKLRDGNFLLSLHLWFDYFRKRN